MQPVPVVNSALNWIHFLQKALDLVRSKLQLFQISYEVEMRSKNTNSCCGSSCTKCPPQTPNSIMSSLREGPSRVPTGICVSWT